MPATVSTQAIRNDTATAQFPLLSMLPQPLLSYNVIITIVKGNLNAINLLKDAIAELKELHLTNLLLAIGPTTPLSLQLPLGTKILWTTFTDKESQLNSARLTIVPPNHLTDLSLSLEKLSKTRTNNVQLIIGDFLDNVLSVSSDPAGLYAFLCKLFTRIRTKGETALLLVTEDMHDPKKTAILKRFADAVIEYASHEDDSFNRFEARIRDHLHNQYRVWESLESPRPQNENPLLTANRLPRSRAPP